jgi:hypothetical protein
MSNSDAYQLRMNIRNFLLIATLAELEKEYAISLERGDGFRARCVRELITEYKSFATGANDGREIDDES